jgi:hypothetical protein
MDDKTLKAEAKAVELNKKMALINEFEEDYGSKCGQRRELLLF